jgi:hypothetical protein
MRSPVAVKPKRVPADPTSLNRRIKTKSQLIDDIQRLEPLLATGVRAEMGWADAGEAGATLIKHFGTHLPDNHD